jgi:hypothetical protein
MNPAGRVRCHMAAIVKGYSRVGHSLRLFAPAAMPRLINLALAAWLRDPGL